MFQWRSALADWVPERGEKGREQWPVDSGLATGSRLKMEVPEEVRRLALSGKKIAAVKSLRELTGIGLTEAKQLVDSLPLGGKAAPGPVAYTGGRKPAEEPSSRTSYGNLALGGLVLGSFFCCISFYHIVMALETQRWNRAEGTVVVSRIARGPDTPDVPVIEYEYQVSGQNYRSDRIGYSIVGSSSDARVFRDKYPVGKQVTVYYKPEDPSSAVLEPGLRWPIFLFLGVGVAFLAACFWAKKKTREQAHPGPYGPITQ